ncbi:hypothetical protein B9Z55_006082 [Caenorhabditis nigoni]|uniref:SPK domain-containing protein n=1 Tax=Caenorhabditis nigoni TaxID=1611254 RepID=A0A2G5V3K9_9PELO|nr:hypothetical protein B9Z55_006082 [Caenorhabditis nigoni]
MPEVTKTPDVFERSIQFISRNIEKYEKPESLLKWCELAKSETGYDKLATSSQKGVKNRLEHIEFLTGYTLMQKVRLAFVLSRPVSDEFVQMLKDGGSLVETKGKLIVFFCSSDKTCILQSAHSKNHRMFQGKREVNDMMDPDDKEPMEKRMKMEKENVRGSDMDMDEVLLEVEKISKEDSIQEEKAVEKLPATISLLDLSERIETLAIKMNLTEMFKKKAANAVLLCKEKDQVRMDFSLRHQKWIFRRVFVDDFSVLFKSIFKSNIKRERVSDSNEITVKLYKVIKDLKKCLIVPFGKAMMDAVGLSDDNITRREEREEKVQLKTVTTKLDGLMSILSNFWTD